MKSIRALGIAAAVLLSGVSVSAAQAEDDITKQIVNSPNSGSWTITGDPSARSVRDADVQGGKAMVVNSPAAGNQWEISGSNLILKKVSSGDKLAAAVWLKAKVADGQPARIHALVQPVDAPWTPIAETDFTVTEAWKLYTFEVTAPQDYDSKKIAFNLHLKTGHQTVYLGPAFVLNLSRNY